MVNPACMFRLASVVGQVSKMDDGSSYAEDYLANIQPPYVDDIGEIDRTDLLRLRQLVSDLKDGNLQWTKPYSAIANFQPTSAPSDSSESADNGSDTGTV